MNEVEFHPQRPTIKVGSLITAYHKGYHVVTKLYVSPAYGSLTPLVEYYSLLSSKGTKTGRRVRTCHIEYCDEVDAGFIEDQYQKEIKSAKQKRDMILGVLKKI